MSFPDPGGYSWSRSVIGGAKYARLKFDMLDLLIVAILNRRALIGSLATNRLLYPGFGVPCEGFRKRSVKTCVNFRVFASELFSDEIS